MNEYFDKMIDAIFRHKGTLNKFLSDGFMAMFGAPADDPRHQERPRSEVMRSTPMEYPVTLERAGDTGQAPDDWRRGRGEGGGAVPGDRPGSIIEKAAWIRDLWILRLNLPTISVEHA